MQRPSKQLIDLLKHFEAYREKVYICPAGYPTIGYGEVVEFKRRKSVPPALATMTTTRKEAIRKLHHHLAAECVLIAGLIDPAVFATLKQHQRDALYSLVYNIGLGRFKRSGQRRALNNGDLDLMPSHFASWRRGNRKILPGLVRRRCAEIKLWLGKPVTYELDKNYFYENL